MAEGQLSWSQIRLFNEAHIDNHIECTKWLIGKGIFKGPSICELHNRRRVLFCRKNGQYPLWRCRECRSRPLPVAEGSIISESRMPIGEIMMIALCFAQNATYEATRQACIFTPGDRGPTDQTIANWFGIFRELICIRFGQFASASEVDKIGGPEMIVQVDEALIGRRKYNRGRSLVQTWIVGLIDEDGAIRIEPVKDRKRPTLHALVKKWVRVGSRVHTDCWTAYRGLDKLGFTHSTVNHSAGQFVAPDGTHTQLIESIWRQMRRTTSRGGIRHKDIPVRLAEFCWRRECKRRGVDAFDDLIKYLQSM